MTWYGMFNDISSAIYLYLLCVDHLSVKTKDVKALRHTQFSLMIMLPFMVDFCNVHRVIWDWDFLM